MEHDVTRDPAALAGTVVGKTYGVQNKSNGVIHVSRSALAPSSTDGAEAGKREWAYLTLDLGESIWVSGKAGGQVFYDESA